MPTKFYLSAESVYNEIYVVEAEDEEQAVAFLLDEDMEEWVKHCDLHDPGEWDRFINTDDIDVDDIDVEE